VFIGSVQSRGGVPVGDVIVKEKKIAQGGGLRGGEDGWLRVGDVKR